ncbi:MAG: hypothetical protein KAG94_01295 [Clostridiales bacterium]|nr:hypothetical protein [Clostridiales bacterium]
MFHTDDLLYDDFLEKITKVIETNRDVDVIAPRKDLIYNNHRVKAKGYFSILNFISKIKNIDNILIKLNIRDFTLFYQIILTKIIYHKLNRHSNKKYHINLDKESILNSHNLEIFDVEELQSQGGSLRLYIKKSSNRFYPRSNNVEKITKKELDFKLDQFKTYNDLNIYAKQ